MDTEHPAARRTPRSRFYDGAPYARLIDPVNERLQGLVAEQVEPGARILDIGCGTGALALRLAPRSAEVVGVELSPAMVEYANRRLAGAGPRNVEFVLGDVTGAVAARPRDHFDVATMVLVLHEMPAPARAPALREAARVARRVICLDYGVPMPLGLAGLVFRTLEVMAGLEHFRAFLDFGRRGGARGIALDAGLRYRPLRTVAGGALEVGEIRRPAPSAPSPSVA